MKEFLNTSELARTILYFKENYEHPVAAAKVLREGLESGDETIQIMVDAQLKLPAWVVIQSILADEKELDRLKGVFTEGEIKAIMGVVGGMVMPIKHRVNPLSLVPELADAEVKYHAVKMVGASVTEIAAKLNTLPVATYYVFIDKIYDFWSNQQSDEPMDYDAFIQKYV